MCNFMQKGIEQARKTMNKNIGGPFGAVIVKDNKIISVNSNQVLKTNDPTAHAEIMAIREACEKLGTYDLSDCVMYATGYPCPMCLSAMIWANIKTCYYGCRPEDAEKIGFRDDFIYDFIKNKNQDASIMQFSELSREDCLKLFNEYHEKEKVIY